MAIITEEPKTSDMGVLEVSPQSDVKLDSTDIDRRDMWRMGKVQELRVRTKYANSNDLPRTDIYAAVFRTVGHHRLRFHTGLCLGICSHYSHMVSTERRAGRCGIHVPRVLRRPRFEHTFTR